MLKIFKYVDMRGDRNHSMLNCGIMNWIAKYTPTYTHTNVTVNNRKLYAHHDGSLRQEIKPGYYKQPVCTCGQGSNARIRGLFLLSTAGFYCLTCAQQHRAYAVYGNALIYAHLTP